MSQESKSPLSSLLPVLIFGIGAILVLQILGPKESDKLPVDNQTEPIPAESPKPVADQTLADFEFEKNQPIQKIEVDTNTNIYVLNTLGGRIDKVYVKSRANVRLPETVMNDSDDVIEKEKHALEITLGNGMDFQPHIYYRQMNDGSTPFENPELNRAVFRLETSQPSDGISEYRFSLPLRFKGHRLELIKVYRFIENENFFHQVTILRNKEARPFLLGGDLFFKPFAGVGPGPETDTSRELAYFGRFINYNDSLSRLPGYGAGGSGWFGCSGGSKGRYTLYLDAPDTLAYLGAHSRYFIAYARFLPTDSKLSALDGAVVTNEPSLKSDAFYTGVFRNFTLAAEQPAELALKSAKPRINDLVKLDQMRNDAVVVNMQVFAGLRADNEHVFYNPSVSGAEFGEERPDSALRDVIYSSTFLALFAKVRDGIIWLLRVIEGMVGNYGYAIIIIAVGWKLVTYPLNQMQAKTMKKMSALKPDMDVINEKYKDDPNERQKKIMEVYKKHKINPAKGCLPMLIQIPIFIALYSAFTESIELWRSPFILWMKDLSEPDTIMTLNLGIVNALPLNILPLLMVASQFAQQKLTTVSSDPQQKMLMYFMPLIMIFFFWSMPSGVTLYWTVQNIISVLWQVAANRFAKVDE